MSFPEYILLFAILVLVTIFGFPLIHTVLNRIYLKYSYRYCGSKGIEVHRFRVGPKFDETGVKTEKSIVDVVASPDGSGYRFTVWDAKRVGTQKGSATVIKKGQGQSKIS